MHDDFQIYQAQTSPNPLGLEIEKAAGSYVYDSSGNKYLDLVAGVSACTLGHCHPKVVEAIKNQSESYMHVMVYGEFALEPAISFSKKLISHLPKPLESVYLVNSGTEAIEGALKLAKRYTGRSEIVSMKQSYHGNTMGAMSVSGIESQKQAFRPLIPGAKFIRFNAIEDLDFINQHTAAVIVETIQGGAGFIMPNKHYLKKLKERCIATGSLLVFDEIQPGFGRTGELFAFMHDKVVPDILVVGKGMASGMPCGAFISSLEIMKVLQQNPKLGHITTFGGNPVIAAASLATLELLESTNLITETLKKEAFVREKLRHPRIKEIRGKGLMLAIIMESDTLANTVILKGLQKGYISFWLLFEPKAVRLTPPLTISFEELEWACDRILEVLNV